MKPIDDTGREIDAMFGIEPTAQGARLLIECQGGPSKRRGTPARNPGYKPGLELLLRRLGDEDAILTDVEALTRQTENWPIDRRRLVAPDFPLPMALRALRDVESFRLQLGRACAAVGRPPGTTNGGNTTKRLRLTLQWPSAAGRSSAELEALLAGGALLPTFDPNLLRSRATAARRNMRAAGRRAPATPPVGRAAVATSMATVARYERDPKVVAWVLENAAGRCEVCGSAAPFLDGDGEPFLEVHHVRPLGEGGPDQVDNAVATCPNCHRLLHHAANKAAARSVMIARIARLKDYRGGPRPSSAPAR